MGCEGEARAPICRAAANLGVRARVWNLAEICGRGFRPGVAQARGTDPTEGPGLSAAGEHARAPTPRAHGAGRARG